jgi:hypothetical protein
MRRFSAVAVAAFLLQSSPVILNAAKDLLLSPVAAQRGCRKVEFDGAVARGQEFSRALSDDLSFDLQPVPAGWHIRVLAAGARVAHDAAEVATPPYQSINPLLLTTEYGFRAQDVVSWNPRQFQFVAEGSDTALSADEDTLLSKTSMEREKSAAEKRLIAASAHGWHGELKILDASLVAGTADQLPAASAVASHWRTTPHTLVQPQQGKSATPLGEVESLKFRVTLWMPASARVKKYLRGVAAACP